MTESERLWKLYLKEFQKNTLLIAQLKGNKMDVTQTPGIVPEDPITTQMAQAIGQDNSQGTAPYDAPVEGQVVKERFVQTEEMLTGEPVMM